MCAACCARKNIRHAGISRDGNAVNVNFREEAVRQQALTVLNDQLPDVQWQPVTEGLDLRLVGTLKPKSQVAVQEAALQQNITTLHNRVNELGVSEPVIQKQGLDRVVVQLPGVQDTAKAKDIIGRTATLELRMVDDSAEAQAALAGSGPVPFGTERFIDRGFGPIIVKRQVVLTGESLNDAQTTFDDKQRPRREPDRGRQGRPHHEGHLSREHRQAHGHHPVRKGQGRGRDCTGDSGRAWATASRSPVR